MSHGQRIRYLRTPDGVKLAWAEAGTGPVLVKAANWLTHLEYDLESPVWKHWIRFFAEHFRYVRSDERGCGMSEWKSGGLTVEQWTADLETVIDAAQPGEPVPPLVLHSRDDAITSIEEGRILAAGIDGAEFVELDSRNHVLLEHEPAWRRFCEAIDNFTRGGSHSTGTESIFVSLSPREREVL